MKPLVLRPVVYSLEHAAAVLDTSKKLTEFQLKEELKSRNILISTDGGLVPSTRFNGLGYFVTEQKTHYVRGTIPRHYLITKITVRGLGWLVAELLKDPAKEAS